MVALSSVAVWFPTGRRPRAKTRRRRLPPDGSLTLRSVEDVPAEGAAGALVHSGVLSARMSGWLPSCRQCRCIAIVGLGSLGGLPWRAAVVERGGLALQLAGCFFRVVPSGLGQGVDHHRGGSLCALGAEGLPQRVLDLLCGVGAFLQLQMVVDHDADIAGLPFQQRPLLRYSSSFGISSGDEKTPAFRRGIGVRVPAP